MGCLDRVFVVLCAVGYEEPEFKDNIFLYYCYEIHSTHFSMRYLRSISFLNVCAVLSLEGRLNYTSTFFFDCGNKLVRAVVISRYR